MPLRTHFLTVFDGIPVAASASFSVTQRVSSPTSRCAAALCVERFAEGRGGFDRCDADARIASVSHRVLASIWVGSLSPYAARLGGL